MPERCSDNEKFCKLFIGGLGFDTTEETLKAHFEQWGEIVDCVIMKNPSTNRSKGFGFITFKDPESLDAAQSKRPHTMDGKKVDTKRAMPRDEAQENKVTVNKMFVGGLDENTSEDQVKETFSTYGTVEKVEMIKDKATGKQKRFCFVTFDDHDCVDKCVIQKHFQLCGKNVEVKKAVSKNELNQGGPGGMRGGRGGGMRGGRGGGGYGGGASYGGGGYGGAPNWGGYGGPPSGGYNDGSYGGGPGGGYGYDNYGGDGYGNFGSGYGNGTGGGPTRGRGGYTQRGAGPYGGGYGSSNW